MVDLEQQNTYGSLGSTLFMVFKLRWFTDHIGSENLYIHPRSTSMNQESPALRFVALPDIADPPAHCLWCSSPIHLRPKPPAWHYGTYGWTCQKWPGYVKTLFWTCLKVISFEFLPISLFYQLLGTSSNQTKPEFLSMGPRALLGNTKLGPGDPKSIRSPIESPKAKSMSACFMIFMQSMICNVLHILMFVFKID